MKYPVLPGIAALLSLTSPLLADAPENLALKAPYESSAPNTHGWDTPGLTDGKIGGDAKTCYATDESESFPKTVTIDLGDEVPFSTVVVNIPPFGSTKTVEVSTARTDNKFAPFGKKVFTQGKAQREVLTGPKTTARFVRLTYPDHYKEEKGYTSTFVFTSEVEVYNGTAPEPPSPALNAVTPAIKDENRHREFMDRKALDPDIGLLFLGDSITDGWPRRGESTWLKFAPYKPADFGIGGDKTEHVLWRIENGELDGIKPKAVVIMIGTNNVGRDEPEWTAAGVAKIVKTVREKLPDSKILLLGVFPRDGKNSPSRQKNAAVNAIISILGGQPNITYMDIGEKFLDPNGEIPNDIMPDKLHPNAKGYNIWFEAISPKVDELMR